MYFRKQGISICQNPEGALKLLAWLWGSQENYLFCLYGEEDKDWKLDENGRLITMSETARGDGYFYEWMFRNANYQVFGEGITDEYIETYRHWDDEAIPSAMLCVDDIPRPEYEHIWDDYYADGYYRLVDPPVPGTQEKPGGCRDCT